MEQAVLDGNKEIVAVTDSHDDSEVFHKAPNGKAVVIRGCSESLLKKWSADGGQRSFARKLTPSRHAATSRVVK